MFHFSCRFAFFYQRFVFQDGRHFVKIYGEYCSRNLCLILRVWSKCFILYISALDILSLTYLLTYKELCQHCRLFRLYHDTTLCRCRALCHCANWDSSDRLTTPLAVNTLPLYRRSFVKDQAVGGSLTAWQCVSKVWESETATLIAAAGPYVISRDVLDGRASNIVFPKPSNHRTDLHKHFWARFAPWNRLSVPA